MKITVNTPKPRNPLVALARRRRAGSHRTERSGQRQQASRDLRREIHRALAGDTDRMKHSP
jgi:hypothetical protein